MKNFIKGIGFGFVLLYAIVGFLACLSPYWADKVSAATHVIQD